MNSTPSILLHLHYSKIYIKHIRRIKRDCTNTKRSLQLPYTTQRTPFYPLHYSCNFVFYGYATNASTIHSVHIIPIAVVLQSICNWLVSKYNSKIQMLLICIYIYIYMSLKTSNVVLKNVFKHIIAFYPFLWKILLSDDQHRYTNLILLSLTYKHKNSFANSYYFN